MLLAVLLYAGIGAGLAVGTLSAASFRRGIDRMADRIGMGVGYGRIVWLGGTIIAWPVGLYVLLTGRLILVDTEVNNTDANSAISTGQQNDVSLRHDHQLISPRQPSHTTLSPGASASSQSGLIGNVDAKPIR